MTLWALWARGANFSKRVPRLPWGLTRVYMAPFHENLSGPAGSSKFVLGATSVMEPLGG